jgi:hypothetical protein
MHFPCICFTNNLLYFNDKNDKSGGSLTRMLHNVKLNGGKKEHELLMFCDSILRGSAEIMRTLLNEKYVVKPGADLRELTQSLKKLSINFNLFGYIRFWWWF